MEAFAEQWCLHIAHLRVFHWRTTPVTRKSMPKPVLLHRKLRVSPPITIWNVPNFWQAFRNRWWRISDERRLLWIGDMGCGGASTNYRSRWQGARQAAQ